MAIYIPEIDEIYFFKTREYFREVISSYSNGNYRSATVMLYSVAICDILFKLQELKDMYNDSTAIAILKKVEKEQKESSSKSSWEKTLLDEIKEKTQLLDLKALSDLNHLFNDRNLSAHPAMNGNYELISPTQETTIAHINNVLNQILIKPPIFIKDVVSLLTDELAEKKEIYLEKEEADFARYLNNHYFNKMSQSMKVKTFKSLWKFCFKIADDNKCDENLKINRRAMAILLDGAEKEIYEDIKSNGLYYSVIRKEDKEFACIVLLSSRPQMYEFLSEDLKLQIDKHIQDSKVAPWGIWFKFKSLEEHIDYLNSREDLKESTNNAEYAFKHYKQYGKEKLILDFFVKKYINSNSYAETENFYKTLIYPYLKYLNKEHFENIIEKTNTNNQLNEWFGIRTANSKILAHAQKVLTKDFDVSKYPKFEYDKQILEDELKENVYGD